MPETFDCPLCGVQSCNKCKKKGHTGVTCQEAQRARSSNVMQNFAPSDADQKLFEAAPDPQDSDSVQKDHELAYKLAMEQEGGIDAQIGQECRH